MKDLLAQKAHNFVETYKILHDNYKWSEQDMFLRMASLLYASNQRRFDIEEFKAVSDYIKKNTGAFSSIRSYGRVTITSMLVNNFENPIEAFDSLLMCCKILKESKVGNDIYAALSSMVIMLSGVEGKGLKERISRAVNIYGLMRKRHPFITARSDYPTVFTLAGLDEGEDVLEMRVSGFYDKLNSLGFKKGNDLLKMSQILAVVTSDDDETVKRCSQLLKELKELKLSSGASHYMHIALLSLCQADIGETVQTAMELYDYLKEAERSKWLYSKQTVALQAMALVSSDVIEELHLEDLAQAGLGASIQAMVEAQQMAAIAAISASTSAAIAASAASSSH